MALRPRRPVALGVTALVLVGAAVALALAGCGAGYTEVDAVGSVRFERPLVIPPLAESTVRSDGTRVFELDARHGSKRFTGGASSPTLGYDGDYLGPTLRAHDGEKVAVRVHNGLNDTTTLHWHGMHLPAAVDGGPHQAIEPGATRTPSWRIDQPAATLWYHPHPHGDTEEQVSEGLAGMFLVDDAASDALALPHEYGVDDLPTIVQDTSFDGRGARERPNDRFVGALGDTIMVNGTVGPYVDVSTRLVRLRLLDASPARTYSFAFSDGRSFQQIATDSGLLDAPRSMKRLMLAPGERAEVVVRMSPGERVTLRSLHPDLGGHPELARQSGGSDRFDVLQLRAAKQLTASPALPGHLVDQHPLDPRSANRTRQLVMDGTQIDQKSMRMDRIDQIVPLDSTEIWAVENNSGWPHDFHVHDVRFQVLDVDGDDPPVQDRGWKDTVYLRPNTTTRIIMRFEDYADAAHPYMYHCHLLRHEDSGMMGQFVVVRPGDKVPAGIKMGSEHDHH